MSSKDSEPTPEIEMGGITLRPGDRIGSYRYERPIGRGGMADVLLAYDPSNQPMALKVLKASKFKTGRRRFRREFRALAKLHHPNVIQVDSFGDIYGHPYFAMEYVEGIDLHKTIRAFRHQPLQIRWRQTGKILTDISKGLAYIHSHGLIHRDLKPSNVLITKQGLCKITDFGIVKSLAEGDAQVSTTLVGTWAYASPEQISGQPLDHRSDLYSLGIILYAMLTGRRPFAADNMAGYMKLHCEAPPKLPTDFIPEIPSKLEHICLKLLQKSPQDRLQAANEILEMLGQTSTKNNPSAGQQQGPARIPLGGRQKVFDQLNTHFQQLREGKGALIVLAAPEGFGKSRMLTEVKKTIQKQDFPVFKNTISPNKGPFESALQLAYHIAKESGNIKLNSAINTFEKAKGNVDADLRHQLFDYIRETLSKLLEERPQVFLLDDIQHSQSSLKELIHYLSKTLLE